MSVGVFDPNNEKTLRDVTMTDSAVEHVRKKAGREGAVGLRLDLKKSGCSGYMYDVSYVQEQAANDVAFQVAEDVLLLVAKDVLPLVEGTQIDYVKEGISRVLRFNNPNAQNACGCGESFSV